MTDQKTATPAPQEPKKLLDQNIVWFALGVGATAIVGFIGVQGYLEGIIDDRIQDPRVNKALLLSGGVAEARVQELIERSRPSTEMGDGNIDRLLKGAVVAFDLPDGCPEGWHPHERSISRFIVGAVGVNAASVPNQDERGKTLSTRVYNENGGAEERMLAVDAVPSRPLNTSNRGNVHIQDTGTRDTFLQSVTYGEPTEPRPHSSMPPYIALYFCKRDEKKDGG